MISNTDAKEEILDRLMVSRRKAQNMEARFRLKGQDAEAKKMAKKARELTKEIDRLLGDMVRTWTGTASKITNDLKTTNTKLQSSIKALKDDINNADKLSKVIGLIDEVLKIAAKL